MIKKLWIAIVAIGITGSVTAQDVKFGAKIGMNVSTITGDDVSNIDSKTGFVLGATSEISFTDKFSVQPELLFSQQGARFEGNFTVDLNYLTLPIMAKYYVAKGFSVEAGPQFSFLVKDEVIFEDNTTSDTNAKNFDLMANVGLGYQLENGIFLQTRYNLGLLSIADDTDNKNGVFQIALGFQF